MKLQGIQVYSVLKALLCVFIASLFPVFCQDICDHPIPIHNPSQPLPLFMNLPLHSGLQAGLCAPNRLCLQGSSAGGWLAASAMLQQPQWFAAVVLTVPCLDPLGLLIEQQQGQLELGMAEADQQV